VSVAILAGGQSRRMGCNKALLELGSSTVLERVIAAAAPLATDFLLITSQTDAFARFGLPLYPDLRTGLGPIGGLYTALEQAPSPVVLLLACDLPFVKTEFLSFLLQGLQDHQAVVPRSAEGLQRLCAVYTRSCLPAVEQAIARQQFHMTAFHDALDVRILEPTDWQSFDPDHTLFANLNTPEDYKRAQDLVERRSQ
jgi:molybdopterin-guanine dinucleotide biosynthesis protein A